MGARFRAATTAAVLLVAGLPAVLVAASNPARAAVPVGAVPRPDHVVVVVEENHSGAEIVGSPNAPYISSLAADNANLTQSFAITHPSQPNYIALFSGSTQGVTDDSCPHALSGPNLGSELIGAGLGFVGYSETQPSAGYTGCVSGTYARKHNPWVNFSSIPAASNQPFTAFPTDYSTLPAVSFVIPNLQNDMHDGTVAQGDAWLQNNLGGYITWAKTHNSLFVLTFDEDDNTAANRIPTIFAGERVVPGTYNETVNHYNVLRTIEDAYGLPALGASATSPPILDVWSAPSGDPPPAAAFTSSCAGASCSFDGSGSTDDTAVAAWSWDFGDGASGTGANPSHTYTASGTYSVTLRVTDDQGATSAPVTHQVPVTAPAGTPFASDTFARTVTNGLGTADVGGAWSTAGSAAPYSVAPGAAAYRLTPGAQLTGFLPSAARTDADVLARMSLSAVPVGGAVYLSVHGRRVSANNEYDAKVLVNADRSVTIRVNRLIGGAETVLGGPIKVAGLTYVAGMDLNIRVQVTGTSPTTVRARLWPASGAEPTTWQVSGTDSTAALQVAGAVGLTAYMSAAVTPNPIIVRYSSLVAKPTTGATNQPPVAAFTSSCTQLACSFSAGGSSDPDGTVTGWAWAFGDGATGTGSTVQHAFVLAGPYSVTLTVTDNQGATNAVTHSVTATAPPMNASPVAAFTFSCAALVCSFDGSGSTDDEGVEGWTWDFGDGGTGTGPTTGATVSHTFAATGSYPVTLSVIDDDDATGVVTHSVPVSSQPGNQPPVAAFTFTCSALSCSFDGTGSTDDVAVTNWAWMFGDGGTGSGSTVSHTFPGTGTYSVQLTARDGGNVTDAVTHPVSVTAAAGTPFVSDAFARTVTNGLGSAPVGGAYTTAGSASAYSVSPGAAALRVASAGGQLSAYLPTVTRTDADVLAAVALDKVPVAGPVYLSVQGRRVSSNNEYDAKLVINADRSVTIRVIRLVGGVETALAGPVKIAGLTYAAGMVLDVRVQVTGTTSSTVRARAWAATGTEPSTWQVSGTDSTAALRAAGSVGLVAYVSSTATNAPITVRLSNLVAKPTAAG